MDLRKKLAKLGQMAELGSGPEKIAAERLIKKIMEKYNIEEESQETSDYPVKYHAGMKSVIINLAAGVGVYMYHYKGRRELYVRCTPAEYEIFSSALQDLKDLYNKEYSDAMKKIKSRVLGFVSTTWPAGSPTCPHCGAELVYDDGRWSCACGYKGKKLRKTYVDMSEYHAGAKMSGRLLK